MLVARDTIIFFGHELITGTHKSTFEITKDDVLGPKGDCIIGIRSSKACKDLNPTLRKALRSGYVKVTLTLVVGGHLFKVLASGSPELTLEDDNSIVVRKSSYTCPRTLAVKATSSAKDFPRTMIDMLKNRYSMGMMIIEAKTPR
ncbi:MAG: DUF371 domain-containing protein [Nitrososphaeria archaeon]